MAPGALDGWVVGWMDVEAGLRIAYSNQKFNYEVRQKSSSDVKSDDSRLKHPGFNPQPRQK